MVLRILFTFFVLSLTALQANEESPDDFYKHAVTSVKNGQFKKAVALLDQGYNIFSGEKAPQAVLELASLCFEKTGDHKTAIALIFRNIKFYYSRAHDKTMESAKHYGAERVGDVPKELAPFYFRLARNLSLIFNLINENDNDKNENTMDILKQIHLYALLSKSAKYKEEESEEMVHMVETHFKKENYSRYTTNYLLSIGHLNYQDKLFLSGPTSNIDLIAPTEGTSLGIGYEKYSAFWGFKVEGFFALLKSNVGENSAQVSYFQKSASSTAMFLSPGLYIKPTSDKTSIGFEIPLFMRRGTYNTPTDVGYTVDNTSMTSIGAMLEGRWYFDKIDFAAKFGKILDLPSSMWMIVIHYRL